ncbi:tyrosine-type recombinase/integrase [Flavobacterium sp.]|jgi:integrase|uniref:tyrosine-type recombinase/integrase n=1 Tax=Flavobacterium sp. TaxID=239 RepID=UPI00261DC2D3|nr:tyrosine-type recombinase/integrase [Flavobacterium sp.]
MSRDGQNTTTSFIEWNDFISLIIRLEKDKEYKFCLLVSIGVFTALRISDLLTLKYSHILDNDIFLFTEKKTKKERSIKVNSTLKEIVQRVYDVSGVTNKDEFIFLNKYGTKCIDKSYVNVKLKELFIKYRIRVKGNVSTHTFRKTLGRRVVEVNNYSNESLVLLMELFGHSNMGITKRYLGITKDEIHNVYDCLTF